MAPATTAAASTSTCFPTEIFSELKVIKTPSADIEEGSLGATVDLTAPRPFDTVEEQVFSMTARGVFNSVSEDIDPRASMLYSRKFFDETFGVLASVAYQKRNIREVGYSAVDVLAANTNGQVNGGLLQPYCTPIGWNAPEISPSPSRTRRQGRHGRQLQHQQSAHRHDRGLSNHL